MKRKLSAALSAAALAALLVLPAAAAPRTVPVTVDGGEIGGVSYLSDGVTWAPLRSLCDALGGWDVVWDASAGQAVAEKDGRTVTAAPGEASLTVGGAELATSAAVYILGGRTYVPVRTLCEALGYQVAWDAALGGAAVTTGETEPDYSAADLYWLSRIISAEAQGESYTGQVAVGNVVLNRVASSEFPDTVQGVVFDKKDGVQFEPVSNGTVYNSPTASSVRAAKAALTGENAAGACLYFYAPALSQGTWINANRTYAMTIGCHRFYL